MGNHTTRRSTSSNRLPTTDQTNYQHQHSPHRHHHHHHNTPQQTQTLGRAGRSTSHAFREKFDHFRHATFDVRDNFRFNRRRTDTERTVSVPETTHTSVKTNHLPFVAINDYTSKGFGDLTFLKEDKFTVFGTVSENGWWYGKSLATGELGFLPESLVAPLEHTESLEWFYSREDAYLVELDLNLPKNQNGTFFVSPSQGQLGCYQLLVLDDGQVHRYRIRHTEDDLRWFVDISQTFDTKFSCLDDLVLHYTHNSGLTTRLTQSCPRITGRKWFFGQLARQLSERMLHRFGTKKGTFLVRESDTQPGVYALSLYNGEQVKHYRIRRSDNGGFFIGPNFIFRNLDVLIEHYKERADGLICTLDEPSAHCSIETLEDSTTTTYQELFPRDKWEVDRSTLFLHTRLGSGHFGEVWSGMWKESVKVAVKMLKPGTMSPREFLEEAQVMKKLRHPKLVQLYAVCTREEPIYIVTELMTKGSLLKYIQSEEGKNLPTHELIDIASQVADGMAYLEEQKYIHRDLAARNILVGEKNVVKIADFGLTRIINDNNYHAKEGTRLPIRWTAPEAIFYNSYSVKSDVWSFGIFVMEMLTGGQSPYYGMCKADVLANLQKGYRMPRPQTCPEALYEIILKCWHEDPQSRPTFECLKFLLEDYFIAAEEHTYLGT